MTILVIAQHDNKNLNDATLNTISASLKIGGNIDVIVAGENCKAVAEKVATISNINKVILVDNVIYRNHLGENIANLIASIANNYSHILAPANTFGKNITPRIAALLDVGQVSDIIEVLSDNRFKRPIYAGNAIATVESSDKIKVITVRTTCFNKANYSNNTATIETINALSDSGLSNFISQTSSQNAGPDLTTARVVVSGGRGLASADNFNILHKLAAKIGNCAIGASRAAVDAGFAPNDYQVGQTGKIVAPELYIAVGISGAIQHLAGMKDSKVIVAINKDENAPIFEVADFGLVADLFDVIPKMEGLL